VALGLWIDYRLSRMEMLQRLEFDSQQTMIDVVRELDDYLDTMQARARWSSA